MRNELGGFDWLAKYYDLLTRIVFGNTLHKSQTYFLDTIPAGSRILIIGGGSGRMLDSLLRTKPDSNIWYIDASAKMLDLSFQKIGSGDRHRVRFIHGTSAALPQGIFYDVIITNFFLDLFSDENLQTICHLMLQKLNRNGLWYATDFTDGRKWWQRILLWTMYRFFVFTCGVSIDQLPSWQNVLRFIGLEEDKSRFFYGGFIKSVVYKKISQSDLIEEHANPPAALST